VDWERLEAEFAAGPALADRIVATARRQRACRAASVTAVATLLTGASVTTGLLVAMRGRPAAVSTTLARPVRTAQADQSAQASIYAAALSGDRRSPRLAQPIWVSSRICFSVPTVPSPAKCADQVIPASVRHSVIALLGPKLHFAADPPTPRRADDPVVIQFGRLQVRTNNARLGVEMLCGPGCGEGQTLVLRSHGDRWHVAGSVGPRWVS
jgi:hypothetical protein